MCTKSRESPKAERHDAIAHHCSSDLMIEEDRNRTVCVTTHAYMAEKFGRLWFLNEVAALVVRGGVYMDTFVVWVYVAGEE